MESFNLNIIPGKTRPVCHASQFDAGRVIRVNLFEDANIYTLSGSEEVSLSVRKPDGNVVTASIENTGDSFVEIVTTEQMTAVAGSNLCELKIEDDGKVIGTMNFILETEQDPLEGGIESQSEINNLKTQVDRMVVDAVADQYDSNAVIFDQEPTAGHGNGYAVTSAGIKAAIDAAGGGSVDFIEEEIIDIPTRELPFYPSGEYADLNTTDKHIVGAINEKQKAFKQYDTKITTNGSGFFNLVFNRPYSVISAWADQGDMIIIPFAGVGMNTNGARTWWFRVMSDTLVARTNTTIDVHILYVD